MARRLIGAEPSLAKWYLDELESESQTNVAAVQKMHCKDACTLMTLCLFSMVGCPFAAGRQAAEIIYNPSQLVAIGPSAGYLTAFIQINCPLVGPPLNSTWMVLQHLFSSDGWMVI